MKAKICYPPHVCHQGDGEVRVLFNTTDTGFSEGVAIDMDIDTLDGFIADLQYQRNDAYNFLKSIGQDGLTP